MMMMMRRRRRMRRMTGVFCPCCGCHRTHAWAEGGRSYTSTTVARTERGAAAPCCFRQGYFNIECENKYVVLSAVVGVLFVCSLLVIDTKRLMGAPAVK
jgi:hypothetical protein